MLVSGMLFSFITAEMQAAAPDAGSIQREVERQTPSVSPPGSSTVITPPEKNVPSSKGASYRVTVKQFVIQGATLIDEASLQAEISSLVGKSLTIDGLNEVADRITALYTRSGYIGEAYLPPQEVPDGVVMIRVVEARLGKVIVEAKPEARLLSDLAEAYVTSSQPLGEYVNTRQLERGLRLLQSTSGIRSSALIRPGSMPSTVDAVLALDSVPLVRASVGYDNFGGVSTGENRFNGSLGFESPLRIGDRLAFKTLDATGMNYARVFYSLPLDTDGVSAGVSASWLGYRLGGDFTALDATGQSVTAGAFLSKTLIAGQRSVMTGMIGFEFRHFMDDIAQIRISDKRFNTITLGLSGGWKDDLMGGGWTSGGASIVTGVLDLSKIDEIRELDSLSGKTEGSYSKLNLNFSREQRLGNNRLSLYTAFSGQLASGNLDRSEKFILGGPFGVRAYPVSEGAGDNGLLFTAELRHQPTSALQLFIFYDWGMVRQYSETWAGWQTLVGEPNTYHLNGMGMGVQLKPLDRLSLRGTMASRLGRNPLADAMGHDHDGTKNDPRFWLESTYEF